MSDAPEPHPVGRHLLGPHVVGQRIVVRHLLPDGLATDVLGVCVSWTETEIVVDRDGAGPVTIRLSDVVTGKPVPPRPSVRQRVAAHDVELHVASLWPELASEPIGGWVLRTCPPVGGRLRRRGNSALAMTDAGLPLESAADAVRSFYTGVGQTALIQVEADGPLEAALAPLGFSSLGSGDAHCQLASLPRALRACNALLRALPRRSNSAPEHLTSYEEDGSDRIQVRLMAYADGPVIASGEAGLDGDWLGLHGLHVEPSHRRQGLGTSVVADLLDWGASLGATTAWLHVETDNEAGLAAYERIGFVTHHTSRYLIG